MSDLIKQIITLLFGGILGVFFKYWYDYRAMVYKSLWTKRYEVYQKLFILTGLMPQYPEKAPVTYHQLFKRSAEMRDWYFNDGGLLASSKTRDKYFKVQKTIQQVLKDIQPTDPDRKIDKEYESIRNLMSQLRKTMTDDLMSRSRM